VFEAEREHKWTLIQTKSSLQQGDTEFYTRKAGSVKTNGPFG
jgi:hypothetical protein